MPRYHFALSGSNLTTDEGSADAQDDIVAMDIAGHMAKKLLNERPGLRNRNFSIIVKNESGDEICRVPVDIVR